MIKQGHYIAQRRKKWEYFGDYYVLASKRSQFHYVALTNVETFALTKKFMFGTIFVKYPELERVMVSEAFSRYVKNVRKPCQKSRQEKIAELNKKMLYSKISAKSGLKTPLKTIKRNINESNEVRERTKNKSSPIMQNRLLYKQLLEEFNHKTRIMQQKSKTMHNCMRKLILDIDESVSETESIFREEISNLIDEQQKIAKAYN